ncbi:hypothetical protein BDW71DRAFT_156481 [Aspergillus fruticulosus]
MGVDTVKLAFVLDSTSNWCSHVPIFLVKLQSQHPQCLQCISGPLAAAIRGYILFCLARFASNLVSPSWEIELYRDMMQRVKPHTETRWRDCADRYCIASAHCCPLLPNQNFIATMAGIFITFGNEGLRSGCKQVKTSAKVLPVLQLVARPNRKSEEQNLLTAS